MLYMILTTPEESIDFSQDSEDSEYIIDPLEENQLQPKCYRDFIQQKGNQIIENLEMAESHERARIKFLNLFQGGDSTINGADIDHKNGNNFNDGRKFII